MRPVKVYTLDSREVMVSHVWDYVEQFSYTPDKDISFIQNADELAIGENIKKLEYPIRKFCEKYPSGEIVEEYIAFDPRLLKLLGIEIDNQKKLDVAHNVIKDMKAKYEENLSELSKYESMSFFGHMKEAFNKLFGGKN